MKCRMVVSGFLCLWAVSQITMPPSAEAGSWHGGGLSTGGELNSRQWGSVWRSDLSVPLWTLGPTQITLRPVRVGD